jgi:hypothetical protein
MMTSTYSYSNGELGIATGLWSDFRTDDRDRPELRARRQLPDRVPALRRGGDPLPLPVLLPSRQPDVPRARPGDGQQRPEHRLDDGDAGCSWTALGERLFRNAAVGRIGAGLFFFHGALSFIPYLAGLGSIDRIINEVPNLNAFLSSGFPYRGEEWGIWTQIVFLKPAPPCECDRDPADHRDLPARPDRPR